MGTADCTWRLTAGSGLFHPDSRRLQVTHEPCFCGFSSNDCISARDSCRCWLSCFPLKLHTTHHIVGHASVSDLDCDYRLCALFGLRTSVGWTKTKNSFMNSFWLIECKNEMSKHYLVNAIYANTRHSHTLRTHGPYSRRQLDFTIHMCKIMIIHPSVGNSANNKKSFPPTHSFTSNHLKLDLVSQSYLSFYLNIKRK